MALPKVPQPSVGINIIHFRLVFECIRITCEEQKVVSYPDILRTSFPPLVLSLVMVNTLTIPNRNLELKEC